MSTELSPHKSFKVQAIKHWPMIAMRYKKGWLSSPWQKSGEVTLLT